jgi:hypothetical protein
MNVLGGQPMQMSSKVFRCSSDAVPSEILMLVWADVSYRQNIGSTKKQALLETYRLKLFLFNNHVSVLDRLCGLVVRVPVYRSKGSGFVSRHYQIF